MQMNRRLQMHIHHHGTEFGSLLDIPLGALYHIMHIKGFGTSLGHSLQHGEAEGDVWHKRAIHHIEVKPVGLTAVYHLDVAVEMQEVGSE